MLNMFDMDFKGGQIQISLDAKILEAEHTVDLVGFSPNFVF